MTHLTRRSILSCSLLLFATAAFAQLLPTPDSAPIALYGDALYNGESELVGRGVVLDDAQTRARSRYPAFALSACGAGAAEIVWREVRRHTDPDGGTHVFYRQHVVGGGLDAELVGSEIGVHRLPNGKLYAIGGQQFESVTISGCPNMSAAKAAEEARERVLYKGEYALQPREAWTMNARISRLGDTKLKLVQIDGTFRAAWFTIGDDAKGEPHAVVLDAENERLLAIRDANPGSDCAPTTNQDGTLNLVTAYSIPVRPELTNWRALKANVAVRGGSEEFTHEAVWIPSSLSMRHVAFHGVAGSNADRFRCVTPEGTGTGYTLFPLKRSESSPIYDDWSVLGLVGPLNGRAVGDALWNTYRTMITFKALGWNGWDNKGSEARVVLNTGESEMGQFMETASLNGPSGSVRIGPPSVMYSLAASLDLVAHEWGHGVIATRAKFNRLDPVGLQMDEGWADVIGMLVEKRAQPTGHELEQSSDWKMHEDAALKDKAGDRTYARGAIDDDADNIPGHDWVGPNYVNSKNYKHYDDRLHQQDTLFDKNHPHATGNMLNVAYLIMAAGGSTDLPSGLNPICARPSAANYQGCEAANAVTFNERLGSSKAGALLFHAITHTVTSSTTWLTVADRVMEAAFAKFNQCQYGPQYNASGEQNTVRKAFAGIGYPPSGATKLRNLECP